jgi:hypothetical protein
MITTISEKKLKHHLALLITIKIGSFSHVNLTKDAVRIIYENTT